MVNTRTIISVGLGVFLIGIAACTNTPKQEKTQKPEPNPTLRAHMEALAEKRDHIAFLSRQLADTEKQLKTTIELSRTAAKAIPQLTTQSDSSLRKSLQYRSQAFQTKDAKAKQALLQRAIEAQQSADQFAGRLVVTRKDMRSHLTESSKLKVKLEKLSAQKETAERLAKTEAQAIAKLQKAAKLAILAKLRKAEEARLAALKLRKAEEARLAAQKLRNAEEARMAAEKLVEQQKRINNNEAQPDADVRTITTSADHDDSSNGTVSEAANTSSFRSKPRRFVLRHPHPDTHM